MVQYSDPTQRYAAQGIAVDCLRSGLAIEQSGPNEGLPVNVSYVDFRAGNIVCPTTESLVPGYILAILLLVGHLAAILVPILAIRYFYVRIVKSKTVLRAPGFVLTGFGALAVCSFGEVAQHIHDNWLYAGLFNSTYNTVFHSALCFGQALLARGIAGDGEHVVRDNAFCGISTLALLTGTIATTNEKNPKLPLVGVGVEQLVFSIVFGMLTLATASFMAKCYKTNERSAKPHVSHTRYAVPMALLNIAGVVSGGMIVSSGSQWYHITTVSSFLAGYILQCVWIRAIVNTTLTKGS